MLDSQSNGRSSRVDRESPSLKNAETESSRLNQGLPNELPELSLSSAVAQYQEAVVSAKRALRTLEEAENLWRLAHAAWRSGTAGGANVSESESLIALQEIVIVASFEYVTALSAAQRALDMLDLELLCSPD